MALRKAVKKYNYEEVKQLIKNGADVNNCGRMGFSSLHTAALHVITTAT